MKGCQSSQKPKRPQKWVLLDDGWLDRDWTRNPISVQSLSKPCPWYVKSSEKYKVCPVMYKVCPAIYKVCQMSVKILSNSKALGQRLDLEIQDLSKYCPMKNHQNKQVQILNRLRTNIVLGQTLDAAKFLDVIH